MTTAGTQKARLWTNVRDAATAAAERGWPVMPGTYLDEAFGLWRGSTGGSAGLCPIAHNWCGSGITTPSKAEAVWTRWPYSLLVECGHGVDVLELPGQLAERPVQALAVAGVRCPVAVLLHPARWLLFMASGDPIVELGAWPGVLYRGVEAWVPLPPTNLGRSHARWHTDPADLAGALPEAEQVQRITATSLQGTW
ncbi:MAG: bifunctional DNA primase/polymerase [Acidimicrobiales bacterium]